MRNRNVATDWRQNAPGLRRANYGPQAMDETSEGLNVRRTRLVGGQWTVYHSHRGSLSGLS